jgi:hypothetical protein
MIIYGRKGKIVEGRQIEDVPCPNCGSRNLKTFGIVEYFHFYWIPFFPVSREVGLECADCKMGLNEEGLPLEMKKTITSDIFDDYSDLYNFTGLILVALLVCFSMISVLLERSNADDYIETPRINDIYIADLSKLFKSTDKKYKYGALKVVNVYQSKVLCKIGTMGYSGASSAKSAAKSRKGQEKSFYSNSATAFEHEKLKEMKRKRDIRYIIRP